MSIGMATALAGAGALASAFGGKKQQTTQQTQSGFNALPPEVQQLLINEYLPKIQAFGKLPYQAIPMRRAQDPTGDPFASKGLWDLQKFSDAAGGYFTPMNGENVNPASYAGAAGPMATMAAQKPVSASPANVNPVVPRVGTPLNPLSLQEQGWQFINGQWRQVSQAGA